MKYDHRWIRIGVAVVVGLKLVGLTPLLVRAVSTPPPEPRPAAGAAADAEKPATPPPGSAKDDAASKGGAVRIPGDGPSAEFAAERRGVEQLVEAIRAREQDLAKRDAALARREAAIAAAAKDLEQKITHLEALTGGAGAGVPAAASGATAGEAAGTPAGSMEELGKIYGAMKAEEAAPLFDRLDTATVREIFRYMKQRQISAVLPLMNPEKAVALTELLGGRRPD
jgi:flagellar motility protein MotE (MotC chaperone)